MLINIKLVLKHTMSDKILHDVLNGYIPDFKECLKIYLHLPTSELMALAHEIRKRKNPDNTVSWIIDRNINISNICVSGCEFCSFFCTSAEKKNAFTTSPEEYKIKIDELYRLGGSQLLLQGGLNPDFNLAYYEKLFKELKKMYPHLKLHALGPPEIFFLSKLENMSITKVLERLLAAGLDSLPGAGAEILCDRVRKIVSPNKCTSAQWLNVMQNAHKLNILTTATMMFGHIETAAERLKHIFKIQALQNKKPAEAIGFIAFIPWTFQSAHTRLTEKYPQLKKTSIDTYIRTIAISRIILQNIDNIQASWLTTGNDTAQLALYAGANDLGSIMIEENVVAASGVSRKLTAEQMKTLINEAGFEPRQRNQKYEIVD